MDPIAAISITGVVISIAASAVSVVSGIIAVKSAKSPVTIRMEELSKKEADHANNNESNRRKVEEELTLWLHFVVENIPD
jgi:hypothetical protein